MTDAPLAWQDWLEKYMAVATADKKEFLCTICDPPKVKLHTEIDE